MTKTLSRELTEIPIDRLRRRRSSKWARYPADVLPTWVAEMDFPLAEPVKLALAEAVQLDDCGYAAPGALGLAEAFAGFAEERMGWSVDPQSVSPSSDVVGAIGRCCGRSPNRASASSSTRRSTTPSSP